MEKNKFPKKLSEMEKRFVQQRDLAPDTFTKLEDKIKKLEKQLEEQVDEPSPG